MATDLIFASISAILATMAGPSYVIGIIRGSVRPQRMTWFIFSVLGVIAFAAQVSAGASWSLVFSGFDLVGNLLTFGLSLWRGTGGTTRLDWAALAIAVVGMGVAVVIRQPVAAILGVILADLCGMWLTVVKTWRRPNSEQAMAWVLFATAGVFGILTIHHWTWGIVLYPMYIVVANYCIPIIQLIRRRMLATSRIVLEK